MSPSQADSFRLVFFAGLAVQMEPKVKVTGMPLRVPLTVPRVPVDATSKGPVRPSLHVKVPLP